MTQLLLNAKTAIDDHLDAVGRFLQGDSEAGDMLRSEMDDEDNEE